MLTKIAPVLRRSVLAIRPQTAVRCMGGHTPAHWKTYKEIDMENKSHMDFMPVPEGSWEEAYKARVAQGNMILGAGLALFLTTVAVCYKENLFYLHSKPVLDKDFVIPK